MIELDIIDYLKSDATLDTLLGASGSDSKIYPLQAEQGESVASPYIIYVVSSEGTIEENLEECMISFNCVSDNYIEAKNIMERLDTLLNKQDQIRDVVSSATYRIYWCKRTGGTTFINETLELFHRVSIYSLKYNIK